MRPFITLVYFTGFCLWGLNIYQITREVSLQTPLSQWTTKSVVRCIGIPVFPVGIVMGLIR